MSPSRPLGPPPRVAVMGARSMPVGLASALARRVELRSLPGDGSYGAYREGRQAVRDGCEVVHLADSRLTPAGLALRRRSGVPVTLWLDQADVRAAGPLATVRRFCSDRLDMAFAFDADTSAVTSYARRLALTPVTAAADPLPIASPAAERAATRALGGCSMEQPVIAVPWSGADGDALWFLDAVLPRLQYRPRCLLFGSEPFSAGRNVRIAARRRGVGLVRCRAGASDVIAAVASRADVLVLPRFRARLSESASDLLALAVSGLPLVVAGADELGILQHERNAVVLPAGDTRGMIEAVNRLLALPALQRHFLGDGFRRHTLGTFAWEPVARAMAERFSSLAGRPPIPAELLAS